jgi:predicted transcriptional regulator of viral defense system
MASRIQIAKPDIVKAFSEGPRVLRTHDVAEVFNQQRDFWRLTKSTSLTGFTRFMTEKTNLKPVRLAFPQREVSGYTWGDVPLLETLLGLVENSYYSHYTAVRIHGLTEQSPKTIYLSREKSSSSALGRERPEPYDQKAIDAAFSGPPRASKNEVELTQEQVRVVLLEGAYQGGIGVTNGAVHLGSERGLQLRYTGLERTLIDIVVRPFYAGGVFEVAKAFDNARDRLSVNTMAAMLKRMAFGYPYHQVVGYYLERAKYKASLVELFLRQPMERDFYLTHDMGKTSFISRWRLHVPQGF